MPKAEKSINTTHWLFHKDPRNTHLYRCFRLYFNLVTITFLVTVILTTVMTSLRQPLPNSVFIIAVGSFAMQMVIWSKARRYLTGDAANGDSEIETRIPYRVKDNFPGWIFVILSWLTAWGLALFEVYDCLLDNYPQINYPQIIINTTLVVVTGIFFLNDSRKYRLAKQIESGWYKLLQQFLQRLLEPIIQQALKDLGKKSD